MPTKTTFRGLLILTIISEIASICANFLEKDSLPLELREYLNLKSHQVLSLHFALSAAASVTIVSLVATEKDMQVVAQAGDGPEALMLAKELEPGGCPTSHFAGARRVGLTANQLNL